MQDKEPTTQLTLKTLLNHVQHFAGFVYRSVRLAGSIIEVRIEAHAQCRPRCSHCRKHRPGYDRLAERRWLFVPLWGLKVYFLYAPRRVQCPHHGIVVEHLPWSDGKRPLTTAMMGFLARWARRLSWRETARIFQTSWEAVYRSVEWFVECGLVLRDLNGIKAIGIDEIHWGRGKRAANFRWGNTKSYLPHPWSAGLARHSRGFPPAPSRARCLRTVCRRRHGRGRILEPASEGRVSGCDRGRRIVVRDGQFERSRSTRSARFSRARRPRVSNGFVRSCALPAATRRYCALPGATGLDTRATGGLPGFSRRCTAFGSRCDTALLGATRRSSISRPIWTGCSLVVASGAPVYGVVRR